MKKWIFIVLLTLIVSIQLFSQPKPRILGVVMGISKYQNVPSLKYADRDAMSFYNFLLSPAGGAADTNNIRLLLNEKATSYNFFEAMDNLLDMAKEGDQVYIYFAGHGDIEKKTERQNGFLIGYNAPPNCYAAGGSISVRFLQDYVETLVSKNKSKVILIVDACRSGKLAGGSQGAEITALALQAEWKGVTKILSCQPGETSLEGDSWGGGAGVFTYFLMRGLKGLADDNKDGKVTVRELSQYLDKNVSTETKNKQIPQIVGDIRQDIAKVDEKTYFAESNQLSQPLKLSPNIQSAGFEIEVSTIQDETVGKLYEKFKYYINNNNLIAYNDVDTNKETALSIYRTLEGSKSAQPIMSVMKRELLAALQNKAQININNWMNGIRADILSINPIYQELKVAYNLIDTTYFQYNQVKFRYLFWSNFVEKDEKIKMKILEECMKIEPNEPNIYFAIAWINDEKRDLNEAYKYFSKATELAKNWTWAWINKGNVLKDLEKYEEAVKCYDKAIEIKPDDAGAWFNKGNAYSALKKYEEAIKYYDVAIKLNPKYYEAWLNKGGLYGNLGKHEEEIKCYDKAIEINQDYSTAWYNKGCTFNELGKYEEAVKCFDKAIEAKPDDYDAWFNKGSAMSHQEKFDEALVCIDEAIRIKPDWLIWNHKGILLIILGRFEEAIKCYDKAIELKPNQFEAWVNKGNALGNLGKYEDAIKCFDKVIELEPNQCEGWNGKGGTYYVKKKYEEAIKFFDKALEIKPDLFEAWYNKACSYSLLRNKEEMLISLKKAIELYPKYKDDAPKDEDFKEYWNNPDFMELVK